MTKDEALRLALEALENLGNHDRVCPQWPTYAEPENYPKCNCGYDQAITAIKAALEAKDEPVVNTDHVICPNCVHQFRAIPQNVQNLMLASGFEPPFTAPPQRKPLMEKEILLAWEPHMKDGLIEFARAIRARGQA